MHFEGPNNTPTFVDSSPRQQRLAYGGPIYLSNLQARFGTTSCRSSNTNAGGQGYFNIDTPVSSPDFALTGDFTVDAWLFLQNSINTTIVFGSVSPTTCQFGASPTGPGRLYWQTPNIQSTTLMVPNQWHHIAVTRESGMMRIFLNGIQENSYFWEGSYIFNPNAPRFNYGVQLQVWFLDELRVLNGRAAWTSDFTPPTAPYPPP
jgi:hypothetical protein